MTLSNGRKTKVRYNSGGSTPLDPMGNKYSLVHIPVMACTQKAVVTTTPNADSAAEVRACSRARLRGYPLEFGYHPSSPANENAALHLARIFGSRSPSL